MASIIMLACGRRSLPINGKDGVSVSEIELGSK